MPFASTRNVEFRERERQRDRERQRERDRDRDRLRQTENAGSWCFTLNNTES